MVKGSIYPHIAVVQTDGAESFVSWSDAVRLIAEDSLVGTSVLESDGTKRPLTREEKDQLVALAKDWVSA